jgi:hypothetical protein
MDIIIKSREKIYDNFLFYRRILPNNSLKCNLRPLEGYSPIYQKYPKSLFNNSQTPNNKIKKNNSNKNIGNLIQNGKTIILTNNKKDFEKNNNNNKINKGIQTIKKKLNCDDDKKNDENDFNIYKKGFNKVYDINQIKQNSAFGGSKNFKSHGVQIYEYKNNLYLPSISQRLKYNKPRYDREIQNDNFYNNNNIYL